MSEEKVISTLTETTSSGEDIAIRTFYQKDDIPDTLECSIKNSVGTWSGVPFKEGELLIKMKNSPEHIVYKIDANGHLLLLISTGDESKYSIDENGHLIYTH